MSTEPMFSCCKPGCREEVSYPSDMLALGPDGPICEECYGDEDYKDGNPLWCDLPDFVPEYVKLLAQQTSIADAYKGYSEPFYELAKMLDIPAQNISPKRVWEEQMRPRILKALSQPVPSEEMIEALMNLVEQAMRACAGGGTMAERAAPVVEKAIRAMLKPRENSDAR